MPAPATLYVYVYDVGIFTWAERTLSSLKNLRKLGLKLD